MHDERWDVDWSGVEAAMAERILKQGEIYLDRQVQLALAADQRANTAFSIFASMATAVAAASIALSSRANWDAALQGGLVGSLLLLLAAACAAFTSRPVDFHTAGSHPQKWSDVRRGSLAVAMGGEAELYQRRIEANDGIMNVNQWSLRIAYGMALLAPIAAVLTWRLSH